MSVLFACAVPFPPPRLSVCLFVTLFVTPSSPTERVWMAGLTPVNDRSRPKSTVNVQDQYGLSNSLTIGPIVASVDADRVNEIANRLIDAALYTGVVLGDIDGGRQQSDVASQMLNFVPSTPAISTPMRPCGPSSSCGFFFFF